MPDLLAEEVSIEPSEEPPRGEGLPYETDGDARRLA